MGKDLLFVGLGLGLLLAGAEVLVRGASALARRLGMSPLLIGLTVVALGTSAPEIGISLLASFSGQGDLALGNVVGSNIFNVLVILGLSALTTPLVVAQSLIRVEIPLLIAVSGLTVWLGFDGHLGRWDGALLLVGLAVYLAYAIRSSRRESAAVHAEYSGGVDTVAGSSVFAEAGLVVLGVVLLVFGSRWLVDGASGIARAFGLSELVIGLTIVAGGTSVPEVATSVMAAIRGERDIAVGNAIGSCLLNLFAVLGLASLISPDGIPVASAALQVDLPIMVATAILCLPVAFTDLRIDRWEGALLVSYYVAYTVWIVLDATGHESAQAFSRVVLRVAVPLTAIGLVVGFGRALWSRRSPS